MRVERRHGEDNFYSTLVPCYDNVCFVWLIYILACFTARGHLNSYLILCSFMFFSYTCTIRCLQCNVHVRSLPVELNICSLQADI